MVVMYGKFWPNEKLITVIITTNFISLGQPLA